MHRPCCKCKIFVLGCKEIHQPNWHLYFSSIKNPSANKCFSSVFVAFFLRRTELLLFIKSKQTAALNHRNTSPQKVFFFPRSKPKSNLKSFVSCELIKLIKSMLAIFPAPTLLLQFRTLTAKNPSPAANDGVVVFHLY